MEAVVNQIKILSAGASNSARTQLIDQLRDLSYSLETPDDIFNRIAYYHLEIAMVRVGVDLRLFNYLAESKTPLTLKELQVKTGAASLMLGRIARYLASMSLIKETGKDTFTSNNVTNALAEKGNQSGICHNFETLGPLYQALPAFLKSKNYQDVDDYLHTVHQYATGDEGPVFEWLSTKPENIAWFNELMAHRRQGLQTWVDFYPVAAETKGWDAQAVVFIDMGGNIGHQCIELKAKHPNLPGRIINQDMPHAINMALQAPGIEHQVHDIFSPQPIKGAKFYHLRAVLHDFPDAKCRDALTFIREAMGPESVILIEEMVLPDEHVHWQVTHHDLTMMAAMASVERTRAMWTALVGSVGLKIRDVYTVNPATYESVMAVVPV